MRLWFPIAVVAGWAVLALAGSLWASDAAEVHLADVLRAPSADAILGRDDLGRSVFARLVAGAQTSFFVAVCVTSISLALGTLIGTASAWIGGALDHWVVRIIDVFLAFPGILLAIALAGILGPGVSNVVIALSVVGWVGFARLARAQTLSLRQRPYLLGAIAIGARFPRIVWWHLLPGLVAPLTVEATFAMAGAVIAEAGLSFLGLGAQPPAASWGTMILQGMRYMLVAPHLVAVPGIAIFLVVLAINLLGDRLRDHLDVRAARDEER
ncbi:MAG: ABC transporter permease [Pseudomonadota bacterium]